MIDDYRFMEISDEDLIKELRKRKRLLNVEAQGEIPTRYLSDMPLGYVQRKIYERMDDPLTKLALEKRIPFTSQKAGDRFNEMTLFKAKIEILVTK